MTSVLIAAWTKSDFSGGGGGAAVTAFGRTFGLGGGIDGDTHTHVPPPPPSQCHSKEICRRFYLWFHKVNHFS